MRSNVKAVVTALAVGAVAGATAIGIRKQPGGWSGFRHRVLGCRPDPSIDGATLADRIRSTIGPLEKHLDLPRIHVMAEGHTAVLHGDVGWPHEAAAIEHAVSEVSGVDAVESHLHVGLLPSDTRPSTGRLASELRAAGRRQRFASSAWNDW